MTDNKELNRLIDKMCRYARVRFWKDVDGNIIRIQIEGASGIGTLPMPPILAAEQMHAFLASAKAKQE